MQTLHVRRRLSAASLALSLALGPALAEGPNFAADRIVAVAESTGWTRLGDARWQVRGDEIVARAGRGDGFLLLPDTLADPAAYVELSCDGDCRAGLLLRATRGADGRTTGLLATLGPADRGIHRVTLDAHGHIVERVALPAGQSEGGLAPVFGNTPPEILAGLKRDGALVPLPAGIDLPEMEIPSGLYRPASWNTLNVILYQDAVKPSVNGGPDSGMMGVDRMALPASIAPADLRGAGAIGLYVGGKGQVRFRNLRLKNLLRRELPAEYLAPDWRLLRLDGFFTSWSTTVADFNRDGAPDVASGPYVYYGPAFTESHEIYVPEVYNPARDYPQKSMVNLAADFTGDGWPDVLAMSGNAGYSTATLYVNPQGAARHWDAHVVLKPIGNEETLLRDLDGDGVPEVVHAYANAMAYSKVDRANPTGTWKTTVISAKGPWGAYFGHGLGIGDLSGDGRADYLTPFGWWEQPPSLHDGVLWTFHPVAFGLAGVSQGGPGGGELGVYDVNGDSLNDVVTSLEGHRFGIAWFEQRRGADGSIEFRRHDIMGNFLAKNAGDVMFTEPHTSAFADMDGDGIQDLVIGKRAMSHLFNYFDADPFGPPVLYVYRTVRDAAAPGGARFEPTLVHNRSGVGAHLALADLDGDGRVDITTAGVYGAFVFLNKSEQRRH